MSVKNTINKDELIKSILIDRQIAIVKARFSFWDFCKREAPEFYTDDKEYLKEYCTTLQLYVERKLLKPNGEPYRILIVELPPRHGKTRTLVLLSAWLLGLDPSFKLINTSYNDDTAIDFSKYTRNTITEERTNPLQIIYNDIFPKSKMKFGDASAREWALEGQYFNYKGAGVGGSITSKGGNGIIIDDPVKGAAEAFNETHLEKLWVWRTGTLLSRQEHNAWQIICHTPWSKKDIGGRLKEEQPDDCYVFSKPAMDENGKMLCETILDVTEYKTLEATMEPIIFSANYKMKRLSVKGLLYGHDLKTYTDFPKDEKGIEIPRKRKSWCDTADQGSDYLCHITADECRGYLYMIDVYYTKDGVEITEREMAERIFKLQPAEDRFESNSGGHAIAFHVKDILEKEFKYYGTYFETKMQRDNKEARLLSNAHIVKDKVLFPVEWKYMWPEFYRDMTNHMKEGKNKNDDAPDTVTAMVEEVFALVSWGLA